MTDSIYRSAAAADAVEAHYRQVLDRWPVRKSELHVPTREGSTFVVACGPEDAPPVVLLHGSQANSAAWMPDAVLWSRKFRLFAVDMIGEAGLSARVRPPLSGEAHALWLDDVFAGLGLSRAALVGTSLGGWLALDYATRRPGFVDALVLTVPAGIGRQKNFLLKALPFLLLGPWGKRRIREMIFGSAPDVLPEALQPIASLMDEIGRTIQPRVVKIPILTDDELRALTMPMLVIVGGRDALIDAHDTRDRLQRCTPGAEICLIEEGYHFLPDQGPRVMNFLVRSLPSIGE